MSRVLPGDNLRRESAAGPVFTCSAATAAGRLAEAVQQARSKPLAFKEAIFDENVWEVTEADAVDLGKPGRTGRRFVRFTPSRPHAGKGVVTPVCVRDFSKAYARRTPVTSLHVLTSRREAIGFIGLELESRGLDSITKCTPAVLDGAVFRAQATRKDTRMVSLGYEISLIVRTLRDYRLTDVPVGEWIPVRRQPAAGPDTTSQAFSSMPADGYLADLADAFNRAVNPVDVVLIAVLTIQAGCWGPRIGSVFLLSEDCTEGLDDGEHLAVRWPAYKALPEAVIDVPDQFAPFVRLALQRVTSITAQARKVKRWYDAHPRTLYLPPELEHVREVGWLTRDEAMLLTGLRDSSLITSLVRSGKVRVEYWPGRRKVISRLSFQDIERDHLSRLHIRMRDAGGPDVHRLFLLPENAIDRSLMGGQGSTSMFESVLYPHLQRRLRATSCSSLWERVGIDRPAGDRTHWTRHLFATLGRSHGVSDETLAQLQRRKNPRQNAPYMHLPDEDVGGLAARTAAVLAAGGDLAAAPAAPTSAVTLASHAAALLRSQRLGTSDED